MSITRNLEDAIAKLDAATATLEETTEFEEVSNALGEILSELRSLERQAKTLYEAL